MLGNNLLDVATPKKTNFEDFEGKKRVMHSTPMPLRQAHNHLLTYDVNITFQQICDLYTRYDKRSYK